MASDMLPKKVAKILKVYTDESLLEFSSKMFLLLGLLEDEPAESLQNLNFKGHSRYIGLKEYLRKRVSHDRSQKGKCINTSL